MRIYGCVAHARCVGGGVVTMGSVHVVCCVPGVCPNSVLTALESLGKTYKVRPLVLKPGKSSYPLPPGKKTLSARHALQSARIAPRPGAMCPPGLPVSEYLMFCRKVLARREKLIKVRKFDKHTYTYTWLFIITRRAH